MSSARLAAAELDALMAAFAAGRATGVEASTAEVPGREPPGDLPAADWPEREPLPVLDAIDARFAEALSARLSARLHTPVRVASAPWTVQGCTPPEALGPGPPALALLELGAHAGRALMVLSADLARGLVAAALGHTQPLGDPAPWPAGRAAGVPVRVTRLERHVLGALSDTLCAALAEAWAEVAALSPRAGAWDTDARLRQIGEPHTRAVVLAHTFSGALRGSLQVIVPVHTLLPLRARLRGQKTCQEA